MQYNKNNLSIHRIASKSDLKPEIASVLFTPSHTVATDSFRLIEMSTPADLNAETLAEYPAIPGLKKILHDPIMLPADEVARMKILKVSKKSSVPHLECAVLVDDVTPSTGERVALFSTNLEKDERISIRPTPGTFPAYQQVMPNPDTDIAFSMRINAEYLAEVLTILAPLSPFHEVTLHFQKTPGRGLYITAGSPTTQEAKALVMPLNK